MLKKIIIVVCLFIITGCSLSINDLSYEEIIDMNIGENDLSNVNSIGYKYYMPINFTLYKDDGYNQILLSNNKFYYMNVDIVSYYYKKNIKSSKSSDDYVYYTFSKNNKNGYLKIRKNNDYFFIEMCYNYAIIEVEVEEKDIKYAVSRSALILNSIKYNDLVIEKNIVSDSVEEAENVYSIPEPENKSNAKNVLEYIKENDD